MFSILFKDFIKEDEVNQELLKDTYFRGNISVPVFVTVFGDVITLEENEYVGIVRYKYGKPQIIARNFKRFCNNLSDLYFVETYLEMEQYKEAVNRMGTKDCGTRT